MIYLSISEADEVIRTPIAVDLEEIEEGVNMAVVDLSAFRIYGKILHITVEDK